MSLLPYLLRESMVDPWQYDPWRFPSFDHDFGLGIHPLELRRVLETPMRLRQNLSEVQKDLGVAPTVDKDGNFNVSIDVQQFKPNEITVKLVDDMIQVEGKHEEKEDNHGFIMRHFVRKYKIPKDKVDINQLNSSMSSDGILTLKAPKLPAIEDKSKVREITIQQVGPARNNVVVNKEKSDEQK